MKGRSCLPNDPKIIVRICFGAFWVCNKMMSYGRLTINFSIVVFAQVKWMFSYSIALLPDARGNMLLYSVYVPSFTSAQKFINYATFLSGRNAIFLMMCFIILEA